MKPMKVVQKRGCGCEAYPFCEHAPSATPSFTPHPWKVSGDRDQSQLTIVQTSTGGLIATIEHTLGYAKADEANANLMAAAPELYRALKQINERLYRWQKFGIQSGITGADSDFAYLRLYASFAVAKAAGR
jgi:hypothetical protein